jgi:hypothetical protein
VLWSCFRILKIFIKIQSKDDSSNNNCRQRSFSIEDKIDIKRKK